MPTEAVCLHRAFLAVSHATPRYNTLDVRPTSPPFHIIPVIERFHRPLAVAISLEHPLEVLASRS